MIVRDDGRAPRSLELSTPGVLAVLGVGAAIAGICLLAGWQLGILTAAL